jgi:hypothetical protein
MKQKIIVCITGLIIFSISISSIIPAKPEEHFETEGSLQVSVFGSSALIGLRRVGCLITNYGEDALYDVHWSFKIKDVDTDLLIYVYDDDVEVLDPEMSIVFSTIQVNDIRLVEILATVNCTQTGEITDMCKMFHLGPFFIGPPFILAFIINTID